ncbi:hypothetical protein GCM10009122_01170 [Fulvivirga kasyanovii]|uniref:Uncharacterized protein n=1 Tax=Fulvivirga kasyanovii TaxID=396812 RepID=A0ABW9RWF1_9BACT|nr:hypothetical protein [Fulvivirga kasyanovii]MTI27558.1 hypothetical protein [Fulvivirga kasyanovii]
MILLEVSDNALLGLMIMILVIIFGPPLLFLILGIVFRKKDAKRAKVFFILSGVYLLIAGGICGTLMNA